MPYLTLLIKHFHDHLKEKEIITLYLLFYKSHSSTLNFKKYFNIEKYLTCVFFFTKSRYIIFTI